MKLGMPTMFSVYTKYETAIIQREQESKRAAGKEVETQKKV
jgi:hypothetical protein